MEHTVILHLCEHYHVGNDFDCVRYATRENVLPDTVEFMPVARGCPVHRCGRQKLLIVFETVVLGIEKVFAVQFYKGKQDDEQIHWLMLNDEC